MWWDTAAMNLKWELERAGIEENCHFDFDVNYPIFQASTREKMNGNAGLYVEMTNTIYYLKWNPEIIVHEAFHHLSRKGIYGAQTYYCLEQIGAVLLSRVVTLRRQNDDLRRELRMTRKRR